VAYQTATVLAEVGARAAYRKHCKDMLERFGSLRSPAIAERTAKACLLLPGMDEELKVVAALARVAVKEGADHEYLPYFEATRALADYRQGRLPAAEKQAKKALGEGNDPWAAMVPARLVLAMTLHRRGQTAAARAELERATALLKEKAPTVERVPTFWQDWVICRLLLREAEGVLARPSEKAKEEAGP
jgi:hypothetical protein